MCFEKYKHSHINSLLISPPCK